MRDFLCVWLLVDCLLIRLHGVVLWKRDYCNKNYFIINSEITALCNRYYSAVLTYIYKQTHTSNSTTGEGK